MNLTELVTTTKMTFKKQDDLTKRLALAQEIAKRYKISHPEMVLMFSHPELSRLPISERCKTLGITEERFLLCALEPDFKRFLQDYHVTMTTAMRIQATDKLAGKITEDRYKYDKDGNETSEDLSMEVEVMKAATAAEKAAPPQVNVQFNLFDEARKRALAAPTITTATTTDTLE